MNEDWLFRWSLKSRPVTLTVGCRNQTMTPITPDQFQALLPLACEWAEVQELFILENGSPLNSSQIQDARLVGVAYPEKIRILAVPQIPLPDHPALRAAAQEIQLITPATRGLTLRNGIFIHFSFLSDRRLIVHELFHTAQYERLGGFLPFLRHRRRSRKWNLRDTWA